MRARLLLLSPLVACASVAYVPVDIEVDVLGVVPSDAETIHMCVEGSGEMSAGAGNGRVTFAGIRADTEAVVTLVFVDEDGVVVGGAGPVSLAAEGFDVGDAPPWLEVEQDDRSDDCVPVGTPASDDAESWVLGTRFTGETW